MYVFFEIRIPNGAGIFHYGSLTRLLYAFSFAVVDAGVIHAGSKRGYLKKNSRIELCMVDKGFGGRQYQKTTLASNPKKSKKD